METRILIVEDDGIVPVDALPDVTARPIGPEELALMLPPGDTGVASADDGPVITERGNEHLITAAVLDPEDEAEDIADFGRITGIAAAYPSDRYDAHVWIDLFADVA